MAQECMAAARDLQEQLKHVSGAAKVNLQELLKDIRTMESGMTLIEKELAWHQSQPVRPKLCLWDRGPHSLHPSTLAWARARVCTLVCAGAGYPRE